MKLIILIFISSLIYNAKSIELECEFREVTYSIEGKHYLCFASKLIIEKASNRMITKVSGIHKENFTNENVSGFRSELKTVLYFPQNLKHFFPNISFLYFTDKLKEISKNDLKPFGDNLQYLDVYYSPIEYLQKDLFFYNPNLKFISFLRNRIQAVHEAVFDNLPNLEILYIQQNKCTSEIDDYGYKSRTKVLEVISNLKASCSQGYNEYIKINNITDDDENSLIRLKIEKILLKVNNVQASCIDEKSKLSQKVDKFENKIEQILLEMNEVQVSNVDQTSKLSQKVDELSNKIEKILEKSKLSQKVDEFEKEIKKLLAEIEKYKNDNEKLKKQIIHADKNNDCEFSEVFMGDLVAVTLVCPKLSI